MWVAGKTHVECLSRWSWRTSDASVLKLHHQLKLPSSSTGIPLNATTWRTSILTSFRGVCRGKVDLMANEFQKVLERITALRKFLSANTTSLDEKALFDSTISCFDTSIPHKILQGVICLSDRTYWKRETTTGLAHFLIYAQNQPCRAIKLKQLHIAYFYAANFIVIRKSQCASHCQPNSKGKALLLDDACISDVIPVKAGHETVDCELIVVTATFGPV